MEAGPERGPRITPPNCEDINIMVWKAEDPEGNEAAKVRFDVVPFIGQSGLDLGCGPSKLFEHFIGVDSGKDIELFGVRMKPDIVVSSCVRMPIFGDQATDCVFSSHLLEHIEDYRAALKEWWRLVKVGGHLVLYLPHRDLYPRIGTPGSNPDHKHDFAPQDIVEAMEEVAADWDLLVNETRDQGREYSFLQVYRRRAAGAGIARSFADPRPAKKAAVVRPGAFGDALWTSSLTAELRAQGYHVTVYTGPAGGEVLEHDPNVDRLIPIQGALFSDEEWIAYYLGESRKYDRFINLIGAVESRLLPHPHELPYHWPAKVRAARMGENYLESMFELAELPFRMDQRFYPTEKEIAWARDQREKLFPGPLVVIAPTGSGLPKTWPHVQRFMELMAARGVYTVVLGEVRQELASIEPHAVVIGTDLPMRLAMTLATIADVVVGTESALINAVASEDNLKVVLLSHSSPENLTKHWRNTMAVEPAGIACYPCHRLHRGFEFCTRDSVTGFAACQAAVAAETVSDAIAPTLDRLQAVKEAA